MSDNYDHPTFMSSEEEDDSSYSCSYLSSNSSSSESSTKDFFNMETRDDSFLENMYHFVRECLSNQELMTRLNPKQNSLKLKKKQISIEEEKVSKLSSKFIKKPSYESKVGKKFSLLEVVSSNKFQIIFMIISTVMIVLRLQDIKNQMIEKEKRQCLIQSKQLAKEMISCLEKVMAEVQNKGLYSNLIIIFTDYHQLFYIAIILIALYMLLKNISSLYSIKSFTDYWNHYKKIHHLNSDQKVKFSDLKDVYIKKSSNLNNSNYPLLANNHNNNHNTSYNIFGISFNLSLPFIHVKKNYKQE